ncbi:MAG: aldehyde ferredoxin oxidoreductase [Bacteroidia bacterium]|nr:aldehyde ferredoxin oxidoreductase [Bacteroidia bacterium]
MPGWTKKILEINLTERKTTVIELSDDICQKFIGGKGLAGYFLRPFIHLPWYSPDMPLLLFTGPLVGSPSPTSGRMTISSRSPLTGTVGDTSAGGKLATQIKKAGWDGIIVRGKSDKLCGIGITDSKVEFTHASNLFNREISDILKSLPKHGSTAVTGPAADNGALFSNISIDGHYFAGRNGLGLIMSSKNLKYIHVTGSGKIDVFDKNETAKAREDIFRLISASPVLKGEMGISAYGTGALYDLTHSRRMMPTDNFKQTWFSKAPGLNAWHYKNSFRTRKTGCTGCTVLCKKIAEDGRAVPEFETMSHFTALLGNDNSEIVMEANRICNETGMDTISAAATLACYAEINNTKIKQENILTLLKDIAYSSNEGKELKHGSYQYSIQKGKPEISMTVKGLELPGYDPRGAYGMALAYATSTRGGCHLRAYPIAHEILRKPVATDRFSFSGKARVIKLNEDMNAMVDSLTACKFIFFAATLEEYARMFSAVTGFHTTGLELLKTGERICYNDRIMNAINGFNSFHDDLPDRFFNECGTNGQGIEIKAINRSDFLQARANYYKIRGLDENGMPLKEKCTELGLEWNG